MADPFVLGIASHKGGTGRTTTALILAWALGRLGVRVLFVDADEQRSASLIAVGGRGTCEWPNVTFRAGLDVLSGEMDAEIVVVDPPALTAPTAQTVLGRADGIILTCLADPLSLRTVPAAANVIDAGKSANPRLELLGILISIYNEQDAVQHAMLNRLQQAHRDLLLDPVVPYQPSLRSWPLTPGTPPPAGPATDALAALAQYLKEGLKVEA